MKNLDSKSHVRGESVYLDDIPLLEGTLFACVYDSNIAHGKLKNLDASEAEKSAGVVRIITAKDLIGENQIGGIFPDEAFQIGRRGHCFQNVRTHLRRSRRAKRARAFVYRNAGRVCDSDRAGRNESLFFHARSDRRAALRFACNGFADAPS